MKINMIKVATILLLLAGCFYSCKENNIPTMTEGVLFEQLESAPRIEIPKKNLPAWLVAKINEYEKEPEPPIVTVQIYKGEWNKRAVYFITSIFFSCYFCNVYYENGEQILFAEPDWSDHFCESSENWVLIYQYGKESI